MAVSSWLHLDVKEIKAETDKAILCVLDNDDEDEVWIPLSQVNDPKNYGKGDKNCTVSVSEWWAKKNDMID